MTEINVWTPSAQSFALWEETPPGFNPAYRQPPPTLTPYLIPERVSSAAVIIFPGGGYEMKAAHEAAPIAMWLNRLGISAFVLDYRVRPYHHPVPLMDARRSIQFVRSRAAEWSIDPKRVGVLGFSAGGHLAATVGTHFEPLNWSGGDQPADPAKDKISKLNFRPDALILCYPVISFGPYGHVGSMENLLGNNPSQAMREALSNETQVTGQTPPTFLWHTASDEAVPVENSLLFAQQLSAHKIPFELHIFASGEHGVGLAEGHPYAEPWTDLCAHWLTNLGFMDKV